MRCGIARAEQRDPRSAGFGRYREAPQLLVARLAKPGEQRVAAAAAQNLLGGPQRVAPAWGIDHRQLSEIDASRGKRWSVGQMRRSKPHHALAGPRQRRQGRQDELQLAGPGARAEDLGQRAGGPAPARQLSIQDIITT